MNSPRRHTTLPAMLAVLALPIALNADITGLGTPATRVEIPASDEANARDEIKVDLNASNAITMALQTDQLRRAIETVDFDQRDNAVAFARKGQERGEIIAGVIKDRAGRLPETSQQEIKESLDEVEEARVRLYQAITKGRESTEERWDTAREELGERHEQFAEALEEARKTALQAGALFESRVSVGSRSAD